MGASCSGENSRDCMGGNNRNPPKYEKNRLHKIVSKQIVHNIPDLSECACSCTSDIETICTMNMAILRYYNTSSFDFTYCTLKLTEENNTLHLDTTFVNPACEISIHRKIILHMINKALEVYNMISFSNTELNEYSHVYSIIGKLYVVTYSSGIKKMIITKNETMSGYDSD